MPDDGPKPVGKVVGLVTQALAAHDTCEPLRSPQGNYGLRCCCGLELWSTDELVVLQLHRSHLAVEIVKTIPDAPRAAVQQALDYFTLVQRVYNEKYGERTEDIVDVLRAAL